MKKLLLLFVLSLHFYRSDGQVNEYAQFALTSNGFVNNSDTTKNYIVFEFPGKTQAQIYKNCLVYLNSAFNSPKDVLSKVENESIAINGYSQSAIRRTNAHRFDLTFNLTIEFKDGRMRILKPSIIDITTFTTKQQNMFLVGGTDALSGSYFSIYNKKNVLKLDLAKSDLENFFNTFIKRLYNSVIEKQDNW